MQNIGRATGTYDGRVQADKVANIVLSSTTEQHFTMPTGGTVARIACSATVFVLTNGQTVTVPSMTDTSFPTPNTDPEIFTLGVYYISVIPGNLFSVAGLSGGTVTVSFYQDTDLANFQSTPLVVNPS